MNPYIIKLHVKGEEERLKRLDYVNWLNGIYTQSAVGVSVEHCLAGRKAKSEYIKTPILQEAEENRRFENSELSEVEVEKQTKALFMKLRIMGANYKSEKQGDKVS